MFREINNIPIKIKAKAGSSAKCVSLLKLLNAFFSVHAQTPTAITDNPNICNQKKKCKILYEQQRANVNLALLDFRYYPKQHVETEYDVLQTATDFAHFFPSVLLLDGHNTARSSTPTTGFDQILSTGNGRTNFSPQTLRPPGTNKTDVLRSAGVSGRQTTSGSCSTRLIGALASRTRRPNAGLGI